MSCYCHIVKLSYHIINHHRTNHPLQVFKAQSSQSDRRESVGPSQQTDLTNVFLLNLNLDEQLFLEINAVLKVIHGG